MDNPRPEKVAVVDEVRERFDGADAALLTEYRGINVTDMAALRRALRAAGGDYKIYKNTLVRFAARELGLDIEDMLTGPTAIAFVPRDGDGDPVMVAKALRDFAKGNPNLIVKGGVLSGQVLGVDETKALADVAPREELLARFAGLLAAPLQQFAGLLQAVPRDFAYGLQALIAQGGAGDAPVAADTTTEAAETPAATETDTETEAAAEATETTNEPTDTTEAAPVAETEPAAGDDTPSEAPNATEED